jgi:hypothetical protein
LKRERHKRAKHQQIVAWPNDRPPSTEIALRVRYVGSAEHKAYNSPAGYPALRSDATPCDPEYTDFEPLTKLLREAIGRACVGAEFIGEFPKYAWGWLHGKLYEARHISNGTYKGYSLEPIEYPRDPNHRLNWGLENAGA